MSLVESRDEIPLRRGDCDNRGLSRFLRKEFELLVAAHSEKLKTGGKNKRVLNKEEAPFPTLDARNNFGKKVRNVFSRSLGEDHGHETNQCRELRYQMEEAIKSGKLAHFVKGIKKGKANTSDTQQVQIPIQPSPQKNNNSKDGDRSVHNPCNNEVPHSPWDKKCVLDLRTQQGMPRTIMVGGKPFNTEHKLNEYKHIEPVKQKKRTLALEQNEASCKEVDELTKSRILREVKYQTWVANPVMVKKSKGGWRMCVDFMDTNKDCPKDCYPLS
ncbi:hypothetical protein Tco_1482928 [Tanacetum coccineum]